MTTQAPFATSSGAMLRPTPDAPPVTTATFLSSDRLTCSSRNVAFPARRSGVTQIPSMPAGVNVTRSAKALFSRKIHTGRAPDMTGRKRKPGAPPNATGMPNNNRRTGALPAVAFIANFAELVSR
jgi:hypothetical protein